MIRVDHVTRRYGPIVAVDDVSLTIEQGEIVGFLGPNGAGKSTLLKMMSTYLAPTRGTITIAGHDTVRAALLARASIGYLTEHNALFEAMHVRRFLDFIARARGLEKERRAERTAWVIERCGIEGVLAQRIRECSKGYRQRIGLAAALIHDPPVLLLDEPTHGLDPVQVVAFREFLREMARGRAILFSSHILAEVVAISDRLLVLQSGRLVLDATTAALVKRAKAEQTGVEEIVLEAVRAVVPAATAPR